MAGGGVDTAVISTADRAKFQRDGCTTTTTATTTTAITIVATTTVATASVPLCTNVLAYAGNALLLRFNCILSHRGTP